ncbi:hypothetical protein ACJO5Y_07680 [Marinobacter sp. GN3S48]|uniref:hypothetical protein n=1 Tax=Marinobacter sp. GN3S48 TaxID=3382302 RepID=UPI00387B1EBD
MNDITEAILRYRECALHTWNTTFQFLEDGDDDFELVDRALLEALVLNRAQPYIPAEGTGGEYIEAIDVAPEFGPKGAHCMYAFRSGNTWSWKEVWLQDEPMSLKFMYFFDWKEWEYRELQYARARIVQCEQDRDIVGADLLIEAQACRYIRV